MMMEIIGLVIIFPFSSFLIMVLGGGDGSKPSVSFLNFEPKVSKFPPTRTDPALVLSPRRPLSYLATSSPFLISLSNRLTSDICTIEKAFCVLFVELAVDGVLPIFDGVCCGDEHIDTSTV